MPFIQSHDDKVIGLVSLPYTQLVTLVSGSSSNLPNASTLSPVPAVAGYKSTNWHSLHRIGKTSSYSYGGAQRNMSGSRVSVRMRRLTERKPPPHPHPYPLPCAHSLPVGEAQHDQRPRIGTLGCRRDQQCGHASPAKGARLVGKATTAMLRPTMLRRAMRCPIFAGRYKSRTRESQF